jgi:hypothetical protein
MPDFRYTLNDEEVEAFQVTEDTRYQEKRWPEWMQSRYLMTIDGHEWLTVNEVETEIPTLGWILRRANGQIEAVDYSIMEEAVKTVVDEPPKRDEPSEVNEEGLVALAAKLAGMTVPEFEAEQVKKAAKRAGQPAPEITMSAINECPPVEDTFMIEVTEAYALLRDGRTIAKGIKALQQALAKRVEWCNCPPAHCEGGDFIGCRQNSPLAK